MGQDSERDAEFVTTVRTDHVAMKTWYNNDNKNNESSTSVQQRLKEKFGEYPSLWKEVLNWPGWKETRKEFLKYQQLSSSTTSTTKNGTVQQALQNASEGGTSISTNGDGQRKRKSRWGSAAPTDASNGQHDEMNGSGGNSGSTRRRSRWGVSDYNQGANTALPPALTTILPGILPPGALAAATGGSVLSNNPASTLPGFINNNSMTIGISPEQQEEMKALQSRLRIINEKMENIDVEAERVDALPRSDRQRSPSPPPIYGPDGKRKNTRAVRWRERYTTERQEILEKLLQMNPATRKVAMSNGGLFYRKRSKKIMIPIEKHPTYNFIGLIIGPRGKTQKELESKTGCKIAIRGRGSVKEGARGRRDGQTLQGDTEPLHVVITGDDQASVDAAASMIEQMLIVIDDEKNIHKQQQLRELALLNGTLKDEEDANNIFCSICAEKGHRSFECPKAFNNKNKGGLQMKCGICGDTSHPTRDCRFTAGAGTGVIPIKGVATVNEEKQGEIDSDYLSFMAELEGKKVGSINAGTNKGGNSIPVSVDTTSNDSNLGVNNDTHNALAPPPLSLASLPPPPQSLPLPPMGSSVDFRPPMGAPGSLPPLPMPPPPSGPPPALHTVGTTALPPPPVGLPPPLPTSLSSGLPPHMPPPHPSAYMNNMGGYNQQLQQQQQQHQYQQPGFAGYNYDHQYQGQYPQMDQQQQHQVKPGEETSAWDPNAYYGSGGGGGELNWWEK